MEYQVTMFSGLKG